MKKVELLELIERLEASLKEEQTESRRIESRLDRAKDEAIERDKEKRSRIQTVLGIPRINLGYGHNERTPYWEEIFFALGKLYANEKYTDLLQQKENLLVEIAELKEEKKQ